LSFFNDRALEGVVAFLVRVRFSTGREGREAKEGREVKVVKQR
jgi:hypothetical protein